MIIFTTKPILANLGGPRSQNFGEIDQELGFFGEELFMVEINFEKWCLIWQVSRPGHIASTIGHDVTYLETIRGFKTGEFCSKHQKVTFWELKSVSMHVQMLVSCSTLSVLVVGIQAFDFLKEKTK